MHQYRTLPEIRLARKIVESGKVGEIREEPARLISGTVPRLIMKQLPGEEPGVERGGGVLINQAPHSIDLFLLLGGLQHSYS